MRAVVRIEPGTLYPTREVRRMPDVYCGEITVEPHGVTLHETQMGAVTLPHARVHGWQRELGNEEVLNEIAKARDAAMVRKPFFAAVKAEAKAGFAELDAGTGIAGTPAEIMASVCDEADQKAKPKRKR